MPGSYYFLVKKISDKLSAILITIQITDYNSTVFRSSFEYPSTFDRLVPNSDLQCTVLKNAIGALKYDFKDYNIAQTCSFAHIVVLPKLLGHFSYPSKTRISTPGLEVEFFLDT